MSIVITAGQRGGSQHLEPVLNRRGIHCTIPDKADQARSRKKRGSHGSRPPKSDPQDYEARHAVECGSIVSKAPGRGHEVRQARGPATRRPSSSLPSTSGYD
ncbi:hypothetical protein GCM10010293_54230 [Streptomyces griseoflavus]|nr:hypothetical protein GCM10010293_54230 [Streptomyces griseoflavus]